MSLTDTLNTIERKVKKSKYRGLIQSKTKIDDPVLLYELIKLYKYMILVQEKYRSEIFQIPFDIKYILNQHDPNMSSNKIKINRRDVIIGLYVFCKSLHRIYGMSDYEHEIMNNRLKTVKIVLWQELNSKKMIKYSRETFYSILQNIENKLIRAILNPGCAIGVLAATSISSILTQLTLNSVSWDTGVILINDNREIIHVPIGEFIDSIIESNISRIEFYPRNRTECVELLKNYYIVSSDKDGKVDWHKISHVTRHLPVGNLMRIETMSGRIICVTQQKSMCIFKDGRFVKMDGKDLKVGDLVPIVNNFPNIDNTIEYLDLNKYLSKFDYLYGSDFNKIKDIFLTDTRKKKLGFWMKHMGLLYTRDKDKRKENLAWRKSNPDGFFTAILPYVSSDSIIDVIRGKSLKCTEIISGYVYPKKCNNTASKIPEFIKLDREFGIVIGLYLAEGWVAEDLCMIISNKDKGILNIVRRWADKLGIRYHTTIHEINNKGIIKSSGKSLKLYSVLIARLFKAWMNTGSSNKIVPDESFVANLDFVCGLLNGYFSGDGTVNKNDGSISVSSVSEKLIIGISTLCSRFGIFGKLSNYKSKKNKRTYRFDIRNNFAKLFVKEIGFSLVNKMEKAMRVTMNKFCAYPYGYNYIPFKDNMLDPIKSISYVSDDFMKKEGHYVYDFTVPETGYFTNDTQVNLANTFHLSGVGSKSKVVQNMNTFLNLLDCTRKPNIKSVYIKIYFPDEYKKDEEFIRSIVKVFNLNYVSDFISEKSIINDKGFFEGKTIYKQDLKSLRTFLKYNTLSIRYLSNVSIRIHFNRERLHSKKISLEDIVMILSEKFENTYIVPLGEVTIRIYTNSVSHELVELKNIYKSLDSVKITGIIGINGVQFNEITTRRYEPISRKKIMEKEYILYTNGINLLEVLKLPYIDHLRTVGNEIREISEILGIEAARRVLVENLYSVIRNNGANINTHFLHLLADFMIHTGLFVPINIYGIRNVPSIDPLQKTTFERAEAGFIEAAVRGSVDNMTSPSSNIITCQQGRYGKGLFDIKKKN